MTTSPLDWLKSLGNDIDYLTEDAKNRFAVCLERRLKDQGLSKADLARELQSSPAYVTKLLRGDANLTIKTMIQLATAVNGRLHLHIASQEHDVKWFEVVRRAEAFAVARRSPRNVVSWSRFRSGSRDTTPTAA
jgi:transcriptional regulator with XRE-family HTH domain